MDLCVQHVLMAPRLSSSFSTRASHWRCCSRNTAAVSQSCSPARHFCYCRLLPMQHHFFPGIVQCKLQCYHVCTATWMHGNMDNLKCACCTHHHSTCSHNVTDTHYPPQFYRPHCATWLPMTLHATVPFRYALAHSDICDGPILLHGRVPILLHVSGCHR